MKILFVDDEIENVKNLAKKVRTFNLSVRCNFSIYLINENADLILYKDKKELIDIGFLEDDLQGFEINGYNNLKESLVKNSYRYDVIVFDRQLQTNERNKNGIDLLEKCLKEPNEGFLFYLVVSKEATKGAVLYDDLKRMGIDIRNYIDNTETTSNELEKELKCRLEYFSNHF